MKTPHVHAELIKAWADGAEIECLLATGLWSKAPNPNWDSGYKYRIKPKPDVVKYMGFLSSNGVEGRFCMSNTHYVVDHWPNQLKLTLDGETGKLKSAEVLK